jgi:Tol biopolymer transport system component
MKNLTITFILLVLASCLLAQDKYPMTQLTNEPAQQGFPSWSPDGEFIIFANTDIHDTVGNIGLWKVRMRDLKIEQFYSGMAEHPRWSPDDRYIVFDADTGNNIKMIPAAGGELIRFIPDNIKIFRGGLPCWSPDGCKLAFLEGTSMSVWVYELDSKRFSKIFQDEDRIPMPGCWMKDGSSVLLAARGRESYESVMLKVNINDMRVDTITGHSSNLYRYIDLSPDGSLLAYVGFNLQERTSSIMVMPVDGGKSVEIVGPPGSNGGPCWSPDGAKIAFSSTRSGQFDIWIVEVDTVELKQELGINIP